DGQGKVIRHFKEVEQRTVSLVRWDDESGMLQVRVPRGEPKRLDDLQAKVWGMLHPAFTRASFSPWNMRMVRLRLVNERNKHASVYHLPTVQLTDSRVGSATFSAYAEDEPASPSAEREAAMDLYLKVKTNGCRRLNVVWIEKGSGGCLERDLR